MKIWEIFQEIPSLIDGSFVSRFTRHSCDLNNDLDTYIGVMTNVEQLADEELGRKIDSIRSIKSLPFPVGEKGQCLFFIQRWLVLPTPAAELVSTSAERLLI